MEKRASPERKLRDARMRGHAKNGGWRGTEVPATEIRNSKFEIQNLIRCRTAFAYNAGAMSAFPQAPLGANQG